MVRRCACFPDIHFSQMCVDSFFFKKATSLPEVATNKSCGKASGNGEVRLNMSMSKLSETILNTVTIRNLNVRYAGTSLSYGSLHIYDQVATWLESCVQGSNQENTGTALQKEAYITQEPKFKRLKTRKNLRTTGLNLCNNFWRHEGKRNVYSTLRMKEETQANSKKN
jgi:hypothetical protein